MNKSVLRIELTDRIEERHLGRIAREASIAARNRCLAAGVAVVTLDGDNIIETSPEGKVTVLKTLQRAKPNIDLSKLKSLGDIVVVVKPPTKKRRRVSRKKLKLLSISGLRKLSKSTKGPIRPILNRPQ